MIYYVAQYKLSFTCFLDYLYICGSLKIAWLINQTKFTSTFKIFVLAALYLIKCFGTQAFLTKFRLCLRYFKLCEKCNLLLGFLVHFLLSFLISYLRPANSTYKANVYNKFLIFLTSFSINIYVATDISMNSNTIVCGKVLSGKDLSHIETSQLMYIAYQSGDLCMVRVFEKSDFETIYHVTDLCNVLRHIVKSNVVQAFKKLLKSESVNRSDLINSVYLWLNFSILFSHVFLKSRRDCRLKSIFMCIVFLCSFFYSPFKHKIIYNDIRLCHQVEVFTPEYLSANNKFHETS